MPIVVHFSYRLILIKFQTSVRHDLVMTSPSVSTDQRAGSAIRTITTVSVSTDTQVYRIKISAQVIV